MKKQPTSKDYEYAITALNDYQTQQSERFKEWMSDANHARLFQELSDYRESVMNLHRNMAPDTEEAWKLLSARIKREAALSRRRRLQKGVLWIGVVAAVLLTAVWFVPFLSERYPENAPVAIYPALDEPQEVVLRTDDGMVFIITDQQEKQHIEDVGAEMVKQENTLRYHQETSETQIAMHTLTTPRGKNFKVILDDGTEVWLNTESRLRYPARFIGQDRTVELEGEAFFHVAQDKRPFIVKSSSGEARVLGTQFNFKAYKEESRHITLVSGSVKVFDSTSGQELLLQPGEDVQLGQDRLIPTPVDVSEYTAWKDGLFYFGNARLTEIMKTIGRWYNLTIVFTSEPVMDYHFSFWASREENVRQTIKRLNQVGKVKVTLKEEQIIISNH